MATEKILELEKTTVVNSINSDDRFFALDSGGNLRSFSFDKLAELVRGTIQIGGRNLLKGTNQGTKNWMINTDAGFTKELNEYVFADGVKGVELCIGGAGSYKQFNFNGDFIKLMRPDCEYTVSMDVEALDKMTLSVTFMETTSKNPILAKSNSINVQPGEISHVSATVRTKSDFTVGKQMLIFIPLATGTVRIKNLKLEEGNIATAWTPAPEDENRGGKNALSLSKLRSRVKALLEVAHHSDERRAA